jgi:hypothetical protein
LEAQRNAKACRLQGDDGDDRASGICFHAFHLSVQYLTFAVSSTDRLLWPKELITQFSTAPELQRKAITFHYKEFPENDTIHSVIIGCASDGRQLSLIVNHHMQFMDVYLPPMRCPVPFIIVNHSFFPSVTSGDLPLIDLPLFSSVLADGTS